MQRVAGGQLTLELLERECLMDAILDKARHAGCVEELLGSWLRGEDNTHCTFCPAECWASRAINLIRPDAIRRYLAKRQISGRLHTRSA